MIKNILSIAGSDPSGGAGIQADLKTFSALGAYGMAAMTALTAQNTQEVRDVHIVPPEFLRKQLEAVFDDVRVDAVKIGMAGNRDSMEVIADVLKKYEPPYVVLDPVMVAQSGGELLAPKDVEVLQSKLVPLANVVTPNLPEAEILYEREFDGENIKNFARGLSGHIRAKAVYLKGGHMDAETCTDVYVSGALVEVLEGQRIDTRNNHGTGCTLSSALATFLAQGMPGPSAAKAAKSYVTHALRHAHRLDAGEGNSSVHHFWDVWESDWMIET